MHWQAMSLRHCTDALCNVYLCCPEPRLVATAQFCELRSVELKTGTL
jgi:hypothetical protein